MRAKNKKNKNIHMNMNTNEKKNKSTIKNKKAQAGSRMVSWAEGAQRAFLLVSCAVAFGPGQYPEDKKIWVQDMGMYGSGTNLLYETIQWSYPLCGTNPSKPELDKIALESDEYCVKFCGLHKHVNPNLVIQAMQGNPSKFFQPLRD